MISVTLPVRLESLANKREHWSVRAARARAHRWACIVVDPHPLPCTVTLTRIAPRLLDDDNLAISGKHVRDGIAARLGVDDRDPRVTWLYRQERGKPRQYACRVEIA